MELILLLLNGKRTLPGTVGDANGVPQGAVIASVAFSEERCVFLSEVYLCTGLVS